MLRLTHRAFVQLLGFQVRLPLVGHFLGLLGGGDIDSVSPASVGNISSAYLRAPSMHLSVGTLLQALQGGVRAGIYGLVGPSCRQRGLGDGRVTGGRLGFAGQRVQMDGDSVCPLFLDPGQ